MDSAAKVPGQQEGWAKFTWPIFALFVVPGALLVVAAQSDGY
ncbi:hypothetical protein AB3X96_30040 [Paraburkholderia sp. BR13439]